ncbi:kinase-like domain-containing protein, partial [Phlyctochytrium arcticum]
SDFEGMEKVGQGTFGEVLLAVCRKTKDKVALKRIIVHKEKDGIPITSIRELTTLKRSSHPNVLSFLGMALETPASSSDSTSQQWDPPTLYMVLPYMDHDLAGLLENRKVVLGASVIKSFMKQLCEGVKYIHQNNILHRDLKTSNVLISNSGHLTLGDFGLARSIAPQNFIHHPDDPTSTTRRGVDLTPNVITLWYRPPELVLGERNYGTAVDMWGVGCIFAEMWDRRPLFRADTEVDLLTAQLSILGTPTPTAWPSFSSLCTSAHIVPAKNFERRLKSVYHERRMEERTAEVLEGLLRWDPTKRMTAMEVLEADYFCVEP